MQRRARKRGPVAPPVIVAPQPDASVAVKSGTRSSSPNWAMPIIYCLLLAGADTYRGEFWGYLWQGIFFVFIVVAAYSTLSPAEFATEQARRPGTTKTHHVLKLGVPYLLVPLVGWALVVIAHWRLGIFVPAVPWVLLAVIGIASVI